MIDLFFVALLLRYQELTDATIVFSNESIAASASAERNPLPNRYSRHLSDRWEVIVCQMADSSEYRRRLLAEQILASFPTVERTRIAAWLQYESSPHLRDLGRRLWVSGFPCWHCRFGGYCKRREEFQWATCKYCEAFSGTPELDPDDPHRCGVCLGAGSMTGLNPFLWNCRRPRIDAP